MYKALPSSHSNLKRRGQTLAEFALTLPLLLLLIFGVVEFGRIFQAWVTIENSAREAIRYTTTGQYDKERYDVNALLPCTGDPLERGSRTQMIFDTDRPSDFVEVWYKDIDLATSNYVISGDSIFATWYDGIQCDPAKPEHLEWREDILRLVSIYEVARRGAAGLALERSQQNGTQQAIFNMMTSLWAEPMPRATQRGYFNVMVCSSRVFLDSESYSYIDDINDDPPDFTTRFVTVFDEYSLPVGLPTPYAPPYCLLNETSDEYKTREVDLGGGDIAVPDTDTGLNHNMGNRWMDPGGPGDAVTVFITFNHPLITPLGLAEYLTIRSYRSGVNEAFRASKAITAPSSNPPTQAGELSTQPPTYTPVPTSTDVPTSTAVPTSTPVPTDTPEPFTCDKIKVGAVEFYGERMYITIVNDNVQDTFLEQIVLAWRKPTTYVNMRLLTLVMARTTAETGEASEAVWVGPKREDIDSATFVGTELDDWNFADKTIPGYGLATTTIQAVFQLGPNPLTQEFNIGDFAGTRFRVHNPVAPGSPCLATIEEVVPEPTTPPPGPSFTPSVTFTPDCASSRVRVEFVDFWTLGVIQLRVTSERTVSSPLLGFNIVWPPWTSFPRVSGPNILSLARVKVGGSNPNSTSTVTVWNGPDYNPSTLHTEPAGFISGYQFPPNSVTNLWIDFDGYGNRLDDAIQFAPWMLHGTRFDIGCNTPGGSGGSGGGGLQGVIDLSVPTPPPPTGTPRPSNTPGPTNTPTPTRPTSTPSLTFTPGPTKTFTLTATVTPFVIPTITPIPTRDGGNGSG
ncbi:MAG: TadE/TadG family type IV pilus assembly protein [bacterium]|nr:TadE/TadG family type IV pilus assembly protein [bacterium]